MPRPPQMPGEKIDPSTGLPPALNNTEDDPNAVAESREMIVQAMAVAATGGKGTIAPPPALDHGPTVRTAIIDGKPVEVSISPVRRNSDVLLYGAESKLPNGTPVNKDGTACDGAAQPYGIVGNIKTDAGWLVGRVIPLQSLEPQAA